MVTINEINFVGGTIKGKCELVVDVYWKKKFIISVQFGCDVIGRCDVSKKEYNISRHILDNWTILKRIDFTRVGWCLNILCLFFGHCIKHSNYYYVLLSTSSVIY